MRALLFAMALVGSSVWALAQQTGDSVKGHDYALKVCAACHSVEGTSASPNTGAPSFFGVANTPGMTEMALGAFLFTPHRQMPDLVIPASDARDLIAYILSLKRLPPI